MNISETRLNNFRNALAARKLRLTDIAEMLGKAPAQVSAFGGKNPTKGIGHQIAREIEAVLGMGAGALDVASTSPGLILDGSTARRIPVLSSKDAAKWYISPADYDPSEIHDWLAIPGVTDAYAFVLILEGMSMSPAFKAGDRVVVDPSTNAESGDYIALKHKRKDHIIVRRLSQEGDELFACATNPDWPNRILPITSDWKQVGKCMWLISKI